VLVFNFLAGQRLPYGAQQSLWQAHSTWYSNNSCRSAEHKTLSKQVSFRTRWKLYSIKNCKI